MSPQSDYMLLHDIVPRLRSAIPIAVSHVGSEDGAELLQDGTVNDHKRAVGNWELESG